MNNRMPSRVGRSKITILRPENDLFTVTPRVFGCLCFVLFKKKKDKFGSQSIKCIFLGYKSSKNGLSVTVLSYENVLFPWMSL